MKSIIYISMQVKLFIYIHVIIISDVDELEK